MSEKPQHPHGKAENFMKFSNDNKVIVDEGPLKKMFEHPEVKSRKIVAFSIIGAYRKGKSFFLDYCLRFLYGHYKSINYPDNPLSNPNDWMGGEDEALLGFSWRSVPTTGEKLAIIVMDTQGLFDNETSPMDNSRIFALGTLISSIQVLNLSGVVQEDQLQYLQFATEFAKFATADSQGTSGKPFQNLLFLIRDWANPDEYDFGLTGGENYMNVFLKIKSDQKEELRSVRQFIKSSFEDLSCFLLPHPGMIVAGLKKTNPPYNGSWMRMEEDFKIEIEKLIKSLLKPEMLVIKKISDKDLIGSEFHEYFKQFLRLFQSDNLPQAQSIYESTIEKQMNLLIEKCKEDYKEIVFKCQDLIMIHDHIEIIHYYAKYQTLHSFKDSKKMGNIKIHAKYQKILDEELQKLFQEWNDKIIQHLNKIFEEKEKARKIEEENLRNLQNRINNLQEIIKIQMLAEKYQNELQVCDANRDLAETKLKNREEYPYGHLPVELRQKHRQLDLEFQKSQEILKKFSNQCKQQ
ncbi:hypothetical protein PVAND_016417 [Polypedilum vanderplanki]|uniref:GB1/RHD3-type G domain-containing protein n=1 Tax=Polypedilum vanderplanki TaxID=319348 RepID=A0A9J6BG72_POLVA|nr:hypothetical protein PVAND_016417 [Polypedilum vanderplanki]